MQKTRFVALAALALLWILCVWIYRGFLGPGLLQVFFLDIGQGDAIYIRSPWGNDMLIDGGPSVSVLRRLAEVMPFYDRSIDVVVATHPDADHIGGLPPVLERYDVGTFMEPGVESKNAIDDEIRLLVQEKGIRHEIARRGMRIDFGDGAVFDILFPDRDVSDSTDTNAASIVGILRYGSTAFMLTGDAGKAQEDVFVTLDGSALRSQVLKAGHHGSKTSSGEPFVRMVAPDYTVISAGADNRYGHPSAEVISLLAVYGSKVVATYEDGTVGLISDGATVRPKEK